MTHEPLSAEQTIADISDRLTPRYPDLPADTIRTVVSAVYAEFSDAKVRDFVEVLVEKQAKKRLKSLQAQA